MICEDLLSVVGRVNKTHGVNGELSVSFDDPGCLDAVSPGSVMLMRVDGILVPFFVATVRPRGAGSLLVRFDDVDSQTAAAQFTGSDVYMRDSDLPEPDLDDCDGLYAADLIGYQAILDDGSTLGIVDDIDDATDNTLFVISRPDGLPDCLVPVADEFIESIDTENRQIILSLPEGLLQL